MREFPTTHAPLQACCRDCWKPESLCLCAELRRVNTKLRFLILQHPQEAKNPLGSARLLSLSLPNAVHKVGLSWRSLSHALGTDANPAEWGVLYLGTQKGSEPLAPHTPFEVRDRRGKPSKAPLKGIVLLDGNWKQSKTLWWRNPWFLKLQRVLLQPAEGSHYGTLRRQPRARCLSTMEAAAQTLEATGDKKAAETLLASFDTFLEKVRANRNAPLPSRKPQPPAAPNAPSAP